MTKELVLMDKDDNIINFKKKPQLKLITGGDPPIENWLANMPKGTIFNARRKNEKQLNLDKYMVTQHKRVTTELYFVTPDGKQLTFWVPTLEFSRNVEFFEVLGEYEFIEDEEIEDGNS